VEEEKKKKRPDAVHVTWKILPIEEASVLGRRRAFLSAGKDLYLGHRAAGEGERQSSDLKGSETISKKSLRLLRRT